MFWCISFVICSFGFFNTEFWDISYNVILFAVACRRTYFAMHGSGDEEETGKMLYET